MAESSQPHNQPEIKEVSGVAHIGVGDINIYPSLGRTVKSLRKNGHYEEAEAVEKIIEELRKLHSYQQMANELSLVLKMLHDLQYALATIELTIRNISRRKRVDFNSITATWRAAIWTPMGNLSYFATNEMSSLDEPNYKIIEDKVIGPPWIVELAALQRSFEASLGEQNIMEMSDHLSDMLNTCNRHMSEVTRQLVTVTNQLVVLSSRTLVRIDNA